MRNVNQAAGKHAACKKSNCDLRSVDLLERNLFAEAHIIDVILISSPRRASDEEISQGREYHLLMISSSSDNTKCTCNVCLHKIWKGFGKRFQQFTGLPYNVLRRKSFCKNASIDRFGQRMVYDLIWTHGCMGKYISRQSGGYVRCHSPPNVP